MDFKYILLKTKRKKSHIPEIFKNNNENISTSNNNNNNNTKKKNRKKIFRRQDLQP